ncbi:hypothetical protein KGM48_01105 [Patescibacteria group bacterium]|nr:hypothetical protein [Patescibacteria group bacterium]
MNQKRLWISAAIIGVFIFIGFVLSVPHTTRDAVPIEKQNAAAAPTVALRDTYKKGVHLFAGSLLVPTACTTASTTASLIGAASSTESILIALSLSTDARVCLQLPTQVTFSAVLVAPDTLPITVTVDGVVASTTAL